MEHDGHSFNWMQRDNHGEEVASKLGLVANTEEQFKLFCKTDSRQQAKSAMTAIQSNKRLAKLYQHAKRCWLGAVERSGMGRWMYKPVEVEAFYLSETPESENESDSSSNSS